MEVDRTFMFSLVTKMKRAKLALKEWIGQYMRDVRSDSDQGRCNLANLQWDLYARPYQTRDPVLLKEKQKNGSSINYWG